MRCAVLVGLVACAEPTPELVPLDSPVTFTISTFAAEPSERPARAAAPQVFIDGVAATTRTFEYATNAEAFAAVHSVELRNGDQILVESTSSIERCTEPETPFPPAVTAFTSSYCVFDSGDLRFGSSTLHTTSGVCVGDGFCFPECGRASVCRTGERCTSRSRSTSPLYARLACAPIGPKRAGDACALIADAAGAYDDCGENLLCVEGLCRATCQGACSGSESCVYVEGQPPELRICR